MKLLVKNNNDLFYTCSLLEFIGRERKLKRSELVKFLGEKTIARIYNYADVFHCEPIAKTADDFIRYPARKPTVFRPWNEWRQL